MPLPEDILAALHSRLEKLEAGYAQRLTEAYRMVLGRLVPEAEAFAAQMQARIEAGQALTANQVRQLRRYKAFIAQAQAEMTRYAAVVENEVATGQVVFARQGLSDALTMVQLALPETVRGSIMATFAVMPTDAIDALVAALGEASPLRTRTLARFGEAAAKGIGDALVYGVASGRGPRVTAAEMQRAWGVPLTDALRISRTEHVRAHRMATMDSYRRNPHVVRGWIWQSALIPGRSCGACVAMNGTRHGLEETLDDHPNGLCVAVPDTGDWASLGIEGVAETAVQVEDGEAWFGRQTEAVQRQMLGPGHYEAWRNGTPLRDMVAWREDPEWGRSIGVKPLKEAGNAVLK